MNFVFNVTPVDLLPCDDLAVCPEDTVLQSRRAEGEAGDEQLVPAGANQGQLKLREDFLKMKLKLWELQQSHFLKFKQTLDVYD